MIKIFSLMILLFGVITSVAWMQQNRSTGENKSSSGENINSSDENIKSLINDSDVVARGIVEEIIDVVRPEELKPKTENSSKTIVLPNPQKYLVGRIFRIKAGEILKGGKGNEVVDYLDVFVPGSFWKKGDPVLTKGQEYVLFLNGLKDEKGSYANAKVLQKDNEQLSFAPKSYYSIVKGEKGVVDLKSEKDNIVQKIKANLQ